MFQLNYRDSRPIYEQLKEQLRKLIVSGVIESDERLPSIREISGSLAINPNTIQRAYRELESEGYIYTIPGKGSFAAPRTDIEGRRELELLQQLEETVTELTWLGYTVETLTARIRKIIEEGEKKYDTDHSFSEEI